MATRLLRITTVPESINLLLRGQLEFMQRNGFEVMAVSADGQHRQFIENSGIPFRQVKLTRKITPFTDLIALVQLIFIMRQFKPHIVHTHTPKAGLLGMIAAWFCCIPVKIHTVGGLPLTEERGIRRILLNLSEKITYACSDKILVNSNALMRFMKDYFKKHASKMYVLANGSTNGIDIDFYSKTPELVLQAQRLREHKQLNAQNFIFGFVGRIVKDKGIEELTLAFRNLVEKYPHTRLLLVGQFEEDLDPLSKETIQYLQSSEFVWLAGYQHDVRPWFIAMDAFVFPSYREGFPNVVMQASCMELPCIVSDINGCNEIISHRYSGLVVPFRNSRALSSAMEEIMMDDNRNEYGRRAREWVKKKFEQRIVWKSLLDEYDNLLRKKGLALGQNV